VLSESSDKTRRAIILVTDGVDTSSRLKMSEAIDSALKADAIIYTIGIGDNYYDGVDEGSLRKLSERTGGRAYFPRNETDLRSAFAQIQDELRSQYLVAYSPSNKAKDGTFRKVVIDVKDPELRKNLKLTYRQGYFARSVVEAKPGRK
jgi:VWFA-related protein